MHAQLLQVTPLFAHPRADHDDTQSLTAIRLGPAPPDCLVASHPWHGQVQQHEVEAMFGEGLDRLHAVPATDAVCPSRSTIRTRTSRMSSLSSTTRKRSDPSSE